MANLARSGLRIRKKVEKHPADKASASADTLVQLAGGAELFHARDGTAYADIRVHGHRETWAIRSRGFRRWLAQMFFKAARGAPSGAAFQAALNVLEAKAQFEGPERPIFVRVGGQDGRVYLDLADPSWRSVEIMPGRWQVVDNCPVRFRRPNGFQPLPVPISGGTLDALRPFLNLRFDSDFVLIVAWALAVLRDRGPYPVLVLSGEQGSAKSTLRRHPEVASRP